MSNFYEIIRNNCDFFGWILGIISILISISIILCSYFIRKKIPLIRISNKISKSIDNDTNRYYYEIKVINETLHPIINVKGKLKWGERCPLNEITIKGEIKLTTNEYFWVGRYINKNQIEDEESCVMNFRTLENLEIILQNNHNLILLFELSATHFISNKTKFFPKKTFCKSDIIKGKFLRGIYTEIEQD